MAIELEIRDGEPWWLSPDIWVVPGADPEGPPGLPIVGTPAFLWASVRNNGSSSVQDAQVRFYWADPSTGFDRNTAHQVGTSFISLSAGQVGETLCLQPWIPEFVNNGHECVLAEVFHVSGDPLPPTITFDVSTDRHVAQRNLAVVVAARNGFFRFNFRVFNVARIERTFSLALELGEMQHLKPLSKTLGMDLGSIDLRGKLTRAAIVEDRCANEDQIENTNELEAGLEMMIAAYGKTDQTLVGTVEGGSVLIHLIQRDGKRTIGGTSVLVLPYDTTTQEG